MCCGVLITCIAALLIHTNATIEVPIYPQIPLEEELLCSIMGLADRHLIVNSVICYVYL